MNWQLLTGEDYATTAWSGGTTTQLAIAPEGAVYANRDFLWRLSSARVELDHSDFTPLPDYNRLLSVLDGTIDLKVGEAAPAPLSPGQVCSFDGGVPVESWGVCTDFNLMVRKGRCSGFVQYLALGSDTTWAPPVCAPEWEGAFTLALYCCRGSVTLGGLTAQAGETLLCREADFEALHLAIGEESQLLLAGIYTREERT